jgi:iron complex outermembrane receptor protein
MFKKTFSVLFTAIIFSFSIHADDAVEEVVVTGSYIKGSPTDGASPVEIFSKDAIENMGAVDIADITANLSVNSGSENNADSFTSGSTQGRTNVNLRGLGLSSTLVLIDGKRQTVAGSRANDGSVFVDTSAIPLVALERVEVLKEGAASIYGSDAVAGVVNYVLRENFTGFEVNVGQQETDLGSQKDQTTSLIWGVENENSNFIVAYSNLDRSPLSGSEFNPSLAPLGISTLGLSFRPLAADTVESGIWAGTYGALQYVGDPNCTANQGIVIPLGGPNNLCGFLFGGRFNIVNDEDKRHLYSSFKTELVNGTVAKLNYLKSEIDVHDNPQSPSYPALSYLSAAAAIQPGTGGSPFNVPAIWYGRPLAAAFPSPLAPRYADTQRVSLSLSGEMDNGFTWDFSMTRSDEDSYGKQPDTGTSKLSAAINGTGGNTGDQTFNLFDPTANSQELLDWLRNDQETWIDTSLTVLDYVVAGEIGNFQVASGFQVKNQDFAVRRNDISIVEFDAAGNLTKPADMIFLGGGLETSADTRSKAVFAEISTDINDQLEVNAAVRYEDLEDDSSVDPKVSFRYQASDDIVLRASFSTSFREASLSQLTTSDVGLQGIQDYDADGNAVGGTAFIRIATINNPNLEAEESDNMNLGVIWSPSDNLQMKLDYWAVDYKNVITVENAQGKVQRTPLDSDVKRNEGGTLVGVTTSFFNAAKVDTNGFDFEATYGMDVGIGELLLGINATHMLQYEIPVAGVMTDVVGLFNHDNFARSLPETKAVLSANLVADNHKLAAYGRWVSSYETTRALSSTAASRGYSQDIDSFFTLDLKYTYSFDFNGEDDLSLSLGVKNAFDEEAPFAYDDTNWSYDPKHHDPRGRMFSMGLKLRM